MKDHLGRPQLPPGWRYSSDTMERLPEFGPVSFLSFTAEENDIARGWNICEFLAGQPTGLHTDVTGGGFRWIVERVPSPSATPAPAPPPVVLTSRERLDKMVEIAAVLHAHRMKVFPLPSDPGSTYVGQQWGWTHLDAAESVAEAAKVLDAALAEAEKGEGHDRT